MKALLPPAILATLLAASHAHAAANLIVNGDFETTTMTTPEQIGYATTTTVNGVTTTNPNTVTGWTNVGTGYNFIFFANNATSNGQYGALSLYTSGNGGSGTNPTLNSPTGGNIVGDDGAFGVSAIQQTVTGLGQGGDYLLTFWWAAGQQTGFSGITTENWGVTFGTTTLNTPIVTTPSLGFTAWTQASMLFEASSTSQVLSFLAAGTPNGQPPFSLLDGVSLVLVPEPALPALLPAALLLAGLTLRRPTPLNT